MLTDDELDFDDFGDLGEVEGPELTNEELEKQLELEFDLENNFAGSDDQTITTTTHQVETEPGEQVSTEKQDKPTTAATTTTTTTAQTLDKPKPSPSTFTQHQKPYYNKFTPRFNNNTNFYPPNQFNFMPNAMAMK